MSHHICFNCGHERSDHVGAVAGTDELCVSCPADDEECLWFVAEPSKEDQGIE